MLRHLIYFFVLCALSTNPHSFAGVPAVHVNPQISFSGPLEPAVELLLKAIKGRLENIRDELSGLEFVAEAKNAQYALWDLKLIPLRDAGSAKRFWIKGSFTSPSAKAAPVRSDQVSLAVLPDHEKLANQLVNSLLEDTLFHYSRGPYSHYDVQELDFVVNLGHLVGIKARVKPWGAVEPRRDLSYTFLLKVVERGAVSLLPFAREHEYYLWPKDVAIANASDGRYTHEIEFDLAAQGKPPAIEDVLGKYKDKPFPPRGLTLVVRYSRKSSENGLSPDAKTLAD
jgi:hypothetical protein